MLTELDHILKVLSRSAGDDEQREAAVAALASLPPEQAQPATQALAAWLAEAEDDRRWWAVRALSTLPGEQSLLLMARALDDPQASVRQCAALGLAERFAAGKSPCSASWPISGETVQRAGPAGPDERLAADASQPCTQIIAALARTLSDADRLAARLAGDALAQAGAAATPALLEILQDAPQAARLEAVRALARAGDTRAIPALFAALDEDSALMEYWAGLGLERMGVGMAFFLPG